VNSAEGERPAQVRVVVVGHVDHGKSTLIGRLLHDTGSLTALRLQEIRTAAEHRGVPFEWSFALDALQSERDQAVTIDTTRIWLRLPQRDLVLIDAPGHKEFLRNMVTGASEGDAALLVVDAHEGVSEQTRRHALLLELIGVEHAVVAINKMDRVDFSEDRYRQIRQELTVLFERIGIAAQTFVPIVARDGDNVAVPSGTMPWYAGPTIVDAIAALEFQPPAATRSLRIAVQGVLRRNLERIIVGRVASGTIAVGDEVLISPSRVRARVRSIESWPPDGRTEARQGDAVGFTLDGPAFVDRGDIISSPAGAPAPATELRTRLVWLGRKPLAVGDRLSLRLGTRLAGVEVKALERVIDIDSLDAGGTDAVLANDVAEVVFKSRDVLAVDAVADHASLARFVLIDGLAIVGGGTVLAALDAPNAATNDLVPVGHLFDRDQRAWRNGHRGAVIWLTGLPAAGKSTLAMLAEQKLFERGFQTYVLDGDNVRAGLGSDLGFSHDDRSENIRRVGEVAALFADAGTIAIAAFISPYRADRDRARRAAGAAFHEVYVKADASVCEARDPKGHYRQARAGTLKDFTGITGDYETPLRPDLVIDTSAISPPDAAAQLLEYIERVVRLESGATRSAKA